VAEYLGDGGPLLGFELQYVYDEVFELFAEVSAEFVVAQFDLFLHLF
jgi:hypothetical protein